MSTPLRIAIADDEADMRDYFADILPDLGHIVVCVAKTGKELVEKCREVRPDLVITDVRMPDMDGIEAGESIAREQSTPVILVSGFHDPALIERAEETHVMAYLVKPIHQADLRAAIGIARRRFEQLETLRKEAADLRQALADRKVIERAKGILMRRTGLDEPAAFRRLQQVASQKNLKLSQIAQMIVTAETTFDPKELG